MSRITHSCALAALSFCGLAANAQNLSALKTYSVITKNDLQQARDVEGRTLIGGNFTFGGSANFGIHMPNNTPSSDRTLIVQGNIATGNPINLNKGSLELGGNRNNRIINYNGGSGAGLIANPSINYSAIFQTLDQASIDLRNLTANSTVSFPSGQPGPLNFNTVSNPSNVAVFDVVGSSIFSNNLAQQIGLNIAPGITDIVINVGGTTINWTSGNEVGNFTSSQWRANTVWNFYEATTINLGSYNFNGQLLAPFATVSSSNNIDGSVYAKNLNSNGEVHFPGYGGKFTTAVIPEVSTSLLSLLGAVALLGRRRRA